jgi:hypothetical protein
MYTLARLLLTNRWGLLIVGAVLLIGGLVWGLSSHQVSYIQINNASPDAYGLGTGESSGNLYINAKGSDDYYVGFASDFQVSSDDLSKTASFSIIARNDTSELDPPLNADDGSTISDAHKIEQLVLKDQNGNVINTFTTSEFLANPNGLDENNWLKAIWLVLLGLIVAGAALIYPLISKKPQVGASFNIGAGGIQQPYQQPQQFGQQPQQFGQQPPQYGQPQPPQYGQPQYGQPQSQPDPYAQSYQGPDQYPQNPPFPPQ